jgi:general stress protein YciG
MSAVTGHSQTQPNNEPPTPTSEQKPEAEVQATTGRDDITNQQLIPDRPPESAAASEGGESARGGEGQGGTPPRPRKPRGFAAMDRKLVSEIARKGGKAAHSAGTAHEFTSEEARVAGRKGGRATHAKRRAKIETEGQTPAMSDEARREEG